MKIMITILGVLIVLAGIFPFLGESGAKILPSTISSTGAGYSAAIIIIGVIGIIYGIMNNMVLGVEKFVTISISALTIIGGVLPFIGSIILQSIPTSGPMYSGLIVVIGGIGIVYGIMSTG